MQKRITWLQIVEEAFNIENKEMHLSEVYKRVENLIKTKYTSKKAVLRVSACVRNVIEVNSEDSNNFRGNNRFKSTRGKGEGYWMMINQRN